MDTEHYHFTRYTSFKKPTPSMKPDLKPSGHSSSFPFPKSCLQQNHLSKFASTFANFRMYFYSPCVSKLLPAK